ncbi:MAG TPA: hypothetical protein VGC96_14270 [Candidatus Elarobacter sp.]
MPDPEDLMLLDQYREPFIGGIAEGESLGRSGSPGQKLLHQLAGDRRDPEGRMIDVVVVYDRESARVLASYEFLDEPQTAFAKRFAEELEYRDRSDVEVVLVSGASMDNLKKSHARYFDPSTITAGTLKALADDFTKKLAS